MDIGAGEGVYGILNLDYVAGLNKGKAVYFYRYKMFEGGTRRAGYDLKCSATSKCFKLLNIVARIMECLKSSESPDPLVT